MSGQTFGIFFGTIIALLGIGHIIYAIVAKLRGRGFLWARNLHLEAEDDGDPVGFKTVIWGHISFGLFMIVVGTYFALTTH